MKTLLAGGIVVTCDAHHTVHAPGDIVLDNDRLSYVGPHYPGSYDQRVDVHDHLLMPGLINAHTHSPMALFRSLADDCDLQVFLQERVWPREVVLTPDDAYAGALLSAVEMLKCGVTTYVDMYVFEEELVHAALDCGIRAVITPGILEAPVWTPLLGTWERRTADVLHFCDRWEGYEGRIHTGLGPHAPYTLPWEALGEIASVAQAGQHLVHIHLVETAIERDEFNRQGRGSMVAALHGLGFFAGPALVAHSIWLDDGDIALYGRHGVGVAHCPQSNCKLGSGIAPVAALLSAQVSVGLGTDSAASNNNLDLWEELRLAPLLAKVTALDPKPVPATDALAMATRLGALAIHQPQLGVLAAGYKADVLMLNVDETVFVPVFSPTTYIAHLVYAGGPQVVDSVWVNGRQVVEDGQVLTVDEAAVRFRAQAAALAVSARVGMS
jgi:5-methylthioadenosine/S-adenosylhomocysteine deaminase